MTSKQPNPNGVGCQCGVPTPIGPDDKDCRIDCVCNIDEVMPSNLPSDTALCSQVGLFLISAQPWNFTDTLHLPGPYQFTRTRQLFKIMFNDNFEGDLGRNTFINFASTSIQHQCNHMDLSGNRIMKLWPETFESLGALQSIALENNSISELYPNMFHTLEHLQVLDLSSNRIEYIAEDVFNGLTNVLWLSMLENRLSMLQANTFKSMSRLTYLTLAENQISLIEPGVFSGLSLLDQLDISENLVTSIDSGVFSPQDLPSLTGLFIKGSSVSNSNLKKLAPYCFKDMVNLTSIYLSYNRITELPVGVFENVKNLGRLDVSDNDIASVQATAFLGVSQLELLDMSDNKITNLPEELFQDTAYLQKFHFANNLMEEIRSNGTWSYLNQLNVLDLSNNKITFLDTRVFEEMSDLRVVGFQNNPITVIQASTINTALNVTQSTQYPIVIDVSNTNIFNPEDLNNMGLPAPLFHGVETLQISCSQHGNLNDLYRSDYFDTSTICKCEPGHSFLFGRCRDLLPIWISVGIISSSLLTGLAFFVYRRLHVQLRNVEDDLKHNVAMLDQATSDNLALQQAWEIKDSEVSKIRKLDSGTYGDVWLADWQGIDVAVKVLRTQWQHVETSEFQKEIDFLMRVRDKNVVRFFGAGHTGSRPFIVMEFMSGGSLKEFLGNTNNTLSWYRRLEMSRDIASGLTFIHSLDRIHRDIKSGNVLISGTGVCKIADFGSAKQILSSSSSNHRGRQLKSSSAWPNSSQTTASSSSNYEDDRDDVVDESSPLLRTSSQSFQQKQLMTQGQGTVWYSAPEVLARKPYSFTADVFSFGVLLWEIAARRPPFLLQEHGVVCQGPSTKQLLQALDSGLRLPIPDQHNWPEVFISIMNQCWHQDADSRPSMSSISSRILTLQQEFQDEIHDKEEISLEEQIDYTIN